MSDYNLLKNKEIVSILDGDKEFGKINNVTISMPYLSGPDLCALSTTFGLPCSYTWGGKNLSRWMYLDNLIEFCIKNKKISDLLSYMFSKDKFTDKLKQVPYSEIEEYYKRIIETIIDRINSILYCSGHEMVIHNKQFFIKKRNEEIKIETPDINQIDREYIKKLSNKAYIDIENGNFDSAITKCRTLLEEVFCYVIEEKNEEPSDSGDIIKLFDHVKKLYSMHQHDTQDKRINNLLSGLNKIVDSISQMRNNASDAHGVGKKRINISDYHARLYVNAAIITAEFIISVAEQNWKDSK